MEFKLKNEEELEDGNLAPFFYRHLPINRKDKCSLYLFIINMIQFFLVNFMSFLLIRIMISMIEKKNFIKPKKKKKFKKKKKKKKKIEISCIHK